MIITLVPDYTWTKIHYHKIRYILNIEDWPNDIVWWHPTTFSKSKILDKPV